MSEPACVLAIDDQETSRTVLARFLGDLKYRALTADSVRSALAVLERERVDVIITDLRMPDMDGLKGLVEFKRVDPDMVVVLVTAYATVDTAVEAMKLGAFDYLKKPFQFDELEMVVTRAVRHRELLRENRELRAEVQSRFRLENLVGKSPAMMRVFDLLRKVAPADVPVLITGESGTGKDLVARAIHGLSPRSGKKFLSLNCAAVPEGLLESELFGHVKGAFTGADRGRPGYFREADGGTLFLDEIADMSLAHQSKLLRVLESGEVVPVGTEQVARVDVRLVAATNKDLEVQVRAGKFREDLLYRIDTVRVELPPLRDRREDIPLLITHFLAKADAGAHGMVHHMGKAAMSRLTDYPWPGNVRELENAVERAVLVAAGAEIGADDLPARVRGAVEAPAPGREPQPTLLRGAFRDAKRQFELAYFKDLLRKAGGNVTAAARLAGIHRATFHAKLRQLHLADDEGPGETE